MTRDEDFTRLEINLKGCTDNYRYFRSLLRPRTKMLVLVKANAYGHGAVEFASLMQAVLPPVVVKNETVDFLFTGKDETVRYCAILSSLLA